MGSGTRHDETPSLQYIPESMNIFHGASQIVILRTTDEKEYLKRLHDGMILFPRPIVQYPKELGKKSQTILITIL